MYTYYGTISFQVVSIFFATAFLLVTVPLTTLPKDSTELILWKIWPFRLGMASEITAFLLIITGIAFFHRNQQLATNWAGWLVDGFEKQFAGIDKKVTGWHLVWIFFVVGIAYNLLSVFILLMNLE